MGDWISPLTRQRGDQNGEGGVDQMVGQGLTPRAKPSEFIVDGDVLVSESCNTTIKVGQFDSAQEFISARQWLSAEQSGKAYTS